MQRCRVGAFRCNVRVRHRLGMGVKKCPTFLRANRGERGSTNVDVRSATHTTAVAGLAPLDVTS